MPLTRRTAPGSFLAIIALTGLCGAALAADGDPATHEAFAEALARAQAENKPVVLDFFTDW